MLLLRPDRRPPVRGVRTITYSSDRIAPGQAEYAQLIKILLTDRTISCRFLSDMTATTRRHPVHFRTDEMLTDAAARGWKQAAFIRQAREIAYRKGASVPETTSFQLFLKGAVYSPAIARKLADALGKPVSDYIADRTSEAA